MIKAYIYGVPNGFDFYEKDAGFNEYFKGFYIASRKGRRLMVNRRDNGDTIYSYLRYGLREVERQPLHSFFGMSIVIGDNQYCPNFKVLLEWFDYIFEKFVNEHQILKKDANGIYYYKIHRFDENVTDVEWLKTNLPNILTQSGQTQLLRYDKDFVDGKTGQVVSFNHPVSEARLLAAFKRFRWISISSDIVDKEETSIPGVADGAEIIELDFGELNEKLNELNQHLLPIAVDVNKGSAAELSRMDKEVKEISFSIKNYLPSIVDSDESKNFKELNKKYDSLKSSIVRLLEKMPSEISSPDSETQYCFTCKQNKPLSSFRSADATKCIECEKKDKSSSKNKTCSKCGKLKPKSEFKPGTDICKDCSTPRPQKPAGGIEQYVTSKYIIGALCLLTLIILGTVVLPQRCSETDTPVPPDEKVKDSIVGKVDHNELETLLSSAKFQELYAYIQGKEDAAAYKAEIKDAVSKYLWQMIDTPNLSGNLNESIQEFFIRNKNLLDFIGFNGDDQNRWKQIANDYKVLWSILGQESVTDADLQKGRSILDRHKDLFNQEWRTILESKPKTVIPKELTKSEQPTTPERKPMTFTLEYTRAIDGKPTETEITRTRGVDAKLNTTATIKYSNGTILKSLYLSEAKAYTVKCDNDIVVTITAKTSRFNE